MHAHHSVLSLPSPNTPSCEDHPILAVECPEKPWGGGLEAYTTIFPVKAYTTIFPVTRGGMGILPVPPTGHYATDWVAGVSPRWDAISAILVNANILNSSAHGVTRRADRRVT
jgi:hypothetical protein